MNDRGDFWYWYAGESGDVPAWISGVSIEWSDKTAARPFIVLLTHGAADVWEGQKFRVVDRYYRSDHPDGRLMQYVRDPNGLTYYSREGYWAPKALWSATLSAGSS